MRRDSYSLATMDARSESRVAPTEDSEVVSPLSVDIESKSLMSHSHNQRNDTSRHSSSHRSSPGFLLHSQSFSKETSAPEKPTLAPGLLLDSEMPLRDPLEQTKTRKKAR